MNKLSVTALATALTVFAGCASQQVVSMRGNDVSAADQAPSSMKQYTELLPTAALKDNVPLIARTYEGQPPLVPHTVEKYEPITLEENDCLDCHISDDLEGRKMPRMGDSHFVTLDKTGKRKAVVNMARYQCTDCHVAQVDAKPLVENEFVGFKKQK